MPCVRTANDLGQEITYGTPKTHQRRSVPIPRSLVERFSGCSITPQRR